MLRSFVPIIAEVEGKVQNFPLSYQIICVILIALFLWAFSISRDPRSWRRLYQTHFARNTEFSVNRNKRLDEEIKKYGIMVAMVFLVAGVTFFVLGLTYRYRVDQKPLTKEEQLRREDINRFRSQGIR